MNDEEKLYKSFDDVNTSINNLVNNKKYDLSNKELINLEKQERRNFVNVYNLSKNELKEYQNKINSFNIKLNQSSVFLDNNDKKLLIERDKTFYRIRLLLFGAFFTSFWINYNIYNSRYRFMKKKLYFGNALIITCTLCVMNFYLSNYISNIITDSMYAQKMFDLIYRHG